MDINELYTDINNLPDPLNKNELYELFNKLKQGDKEVFNKIFMHNMKLVTKEVYSRFQTIQYDKDDLISVGNIGLIKAINTFDISKKVSFSSYAIRCIDNEILMFLRKLKKNYKVESLDKTVFSDKNGKKLKIEDIICYKTDIEEEYEKKEKIRIINEMIKKLPERDRKIIMLNFGFYNNRIYTQQEISKIMSLSRPYISNIISKIINKLGEKLNKQGLIELKSKNILSLDKAEKDKKVKGTKARTRRKIKSIYEYFNNYTKEQINEMLESLSEEEKALIELRYGKDLNNPVTGQLTEEERTKFYGNLIYKMKKLLANSYKNEIVSLNEELIVDKNLDKSNSKEISVLKKKIKK